MFSRSSIFQTFFVALILLAANSDAFALSSRTCNPVVPKTIKYRPKYSVCDGKAALILSGKYRKIFSGVFKKADHNDRLANGCPDASCSPFKAKRNIFTSKARIICFGAAGDSKVFKGFDPDLGYSPSFVVKWISLKVSNSHKLKDVEIYCLPKPYPQTPLN